MLAKSPCTVHSSHRAAPFGIQMAKAMQPHPATLSFSVYLRRELQGVPATAGGNSADPLLPTHNFSP